MTDPATEMKIVPANKASWEDLDAVLAGASCHGGRCYCQRFKLGWNAWPGDDVDRAHMLREQTDCGHPKSATTSGLAAYLDGEAAGWSQDPVTAGPRARIADPHPRRYRSSAIRASPRQPGNSRHSCCLKCKYAPFAGLLHSNRVMLHPTEQP